MNIPNKTQKLIVNIGGHNVFLKKSKKPKGVSQDKFDKSFEWTCKFLGKIIDYGFNFMPREQNEHTK